MKRIQTALKNQKTFSRPQLAIFILAFAIIGYLVFKSFAASNPNLPGDLNNDNTVNAQDLSLLLSNYGTTNSAGDVNSDGLVNAIDLSILLSHYGQSVIVTKPSIPTGLVATPQDGSVKLTWNANPSSDNVDYYQVYLNDASYNLTVTGTSFTVTGLTNGTAYTFRISAHNSAGYGDWTNAISATPVASGGNNFGTSLPAPLLPSTGSQITGSATSSLSSLFSGLSAGTTLCLHSGTYGQGLTSAVFLSVSGTASNPITIKSCPGETATIAQLIEVTGNYIRLSNLKFIRNNYPTNERYNQVGGAPGGSVGIWLFGTHNTVEKSEITGNTMSGILSNGGASYNQILSNYIHDNGTTPDDHCIYWGSDNSLIANNLCINNYGFGVQVGYSSGFNNIIANNTSVHNGYGDQAGHPDSGYVTFGGSANNLFVNNIAYNNAGYGYVTYDTTISLSHNDTYGNLLGSTYGGFASIVSMLTDNPSFVSATDYHLAAGSHLINAGDPAYTPQTDFYGATRTTADIGAAN